MRPALVLFVATALLPSIAQAQMLSKELPRLRWDATKRGSLLIVDTLPVAIKSPDIDSWTPEAVTAAAGWKSAKAGRLTVWVPQTMRIFPEPTRKPDITTAIPFAERRLRLLASLKDSQQKALFSEQGLGLQDLNLDQQRLFTASLPTPLRLGTRILLLTGNKEIPEPPLISDDERNAVRLRVVRSPGARLIFQEPALVKQIGRTVTLPSDPIWSVSYNLHDPEDNTLLGSVLYRDVPNQLKRSELDYGASALNAPLSLDGVNTVGELVALAAKRTGLELYVDPRLALYNIHSRGTSARAGDVLQGLAYALTGTFRKVEGDAWVLTGDIEPVAIRLVQRQKWVDTALAEATAAVTRISWALPTAPSVGSLAGKTEGRYSGAQLSPEIRKLIDQERNRYSAQPVTTLANGFTITSTGATTTVNGVPVNAESFVPDAVQVTARLEGQLLLPDGTVVQDDKLTQLIRSVAQEPESSTPLFPKQIALKRAPSLLLRADSPDSARQAVQLAAARRISELWLALPLAADTATEKAILTAALAEGKTQKVAVGALVHLLATSPDAKTTNRDERLTGGRQPAQVPPHLQINDLEWLAPDAPGVVEKLRARLSALASLEGIAGLALVETAPTGYLAKLPSRYESVREDFGGRPGNRLAFLRQTGADPLDLDAGILYGPFFSNGETLGISLVAPHAHGPGIRVMASGPINLGIAPDEGRRLQKDWQKFLEAKVNTLLPELFTTLRARSTTLPLWIEQRDSGSLNLTVWDRPLPQPTRSASPARTLHYVPCIPGQYLQPSARIGIPTPDGSEALARTVYTWSRDAERLLLDLKEVPLVDVPRWLEGVTFPAN